MRPIGINKILNSTEGNIEIKYNGISKNDNIDLDKIQTLLDDFMNNHRHDDMEENVAIIRTLFSNCEEKLLVISYSDKDISEYVKYNNSHLSLYKINKQKDKDNDEYKFTYNSKGNIKLSYNNYKIDFAQYFTELTKISKKVYRLENIKAITLHEDDKIIIEVYKLFYDENPDFSSKDVNIKIQAMIQILAQFGISLNMDYGFRLWNKSEMPVSFKIEFLVNRLYPFGEVDMVEDNIRLTKKSKRTIKVIGECIREVISKYQNQIEALITISKVIYSGRYNISNESNIEEISQFIECNPSEVKSCMKLVRCIENKISE